MKNKKSKSIIFAFSIVVLLVLGSVGSPGISSEKSDNYKETQANNVRLTGTALRIKTTASLTTFSKNNRLCSMGSNSFNESDNIVVSNATGNESYPSMVIRDLNAMLAYEYEEENETRVYLRSSGNYGKSWKSQVQLVVNLENGPSDIETNSPVFSIVSNSKKAYGTLTSSFRNSGVWALITINDIGNPGNNEVKTWNLFDLPDEVDPDVTYDFWDLANPDIISYDDSVTPWVFALIGSTNYTNYTSGEGPCTNSPMLSFINPLDPDHLEYLFWFPTIQNCRNISISNEFGSFTIYGVCEMQNISNSRTDLLFFKGSPESWAEGADLGVDREHSIKSHIQDHTKLYRGTEATRNYPAYLHRRLRSRDRWRGPTTNRHASPRHPSPPSG